jgi:two-component system, sensor histidine kinase
VRVLIAEDTATGRDVIRGYLDSANFELSFVENGREAVEAAKAERYDIILMDVRMPEMDGLEAIRRIRSDEEAAGRGRTPIVVVSANTAAEDVRECVNAGADGHLAKPVARMDVVGAVVEFVARKD